MTAGLLKGTTLETIERQTQPDQMYRGLTCCAEAERQKRTIGVFEAMAELVEVPTMSVLTNEKDADGDDDMIPAEHVAKFLRNCLGGSDGSPQGSPRSIDASETTTDALEQKQPVIFSLSKKIMTDARLATSMKDGRGTVDNFADQMEGLSRFWKRKWPLVLGMKALKKDYDDLGGFKNEENERKKVCEEPTNMKEYTKSLKVGSSCAVSSAICQTSTSGTELESKLDTEENRNQRMVQGLVDESNDIADRVGGYLAQGCKILC